MCTNLIKDMTEYGVCVIDNFLGHEKGEQILKEVNEMHAMGVFKVSILTFCFGEFLI